KIGDYAFYNAAALAAVDLSGVEEVGDYAFSGIYIKALTFHKGTTDAWCGDAYEEEYDDQGNLVSRRPIYTYFAPKIASVNLSSATKVGKGAFAYNGSLTSATINAGLTEISDNAFASCSKLDTIDLSGATSVGAYAFYGTAIKTVNLGGAKTVGRYAFAESKVETVTLGEGAYLAEGAFAYCFKLSAVVGLSTATYIGGYAFSGSALTAANLSGAEYLGDFAFANSLIEEVEFGDNLSYIGENPFAYCASLASFGKKYTVKAGNKDIEYFTESYDISDSVFVEDGALYRKSAAGFVLASFPEAHEATSVTVKEGTTRISAKAFVGSGIKSVVLPSTLKSLGDKAFYGCNNLGTVVFKSYDAPVLEEAYDASYMGYDNIPISGYTYNYYEDKVYQGLGISKYFMWNYLNSGNNFYYGANFDNYVGKVDRAIVMVSPVNGNNYDSFIFSKYFSASVSGAPAATTETLYAVGLIDLLPENISLSDEAEIVKARAAYDDIPTLEQKSLVTNYGKLTSAENTLQYLKSRSESTPDDSESISEQTETKDNGGIIAIAIISGIVNLVFAAGILLMSISILKGKKSEVEAGGEKTDDEKGEDEEIANEKSEVSDDEEKYIYDDGASDKKE
ncbi:MAG: leucine-rich repeat protein, partial [Clostridia bacterium]|nr:leucine-rich repeat protein [Clostridia bacterium]